MPGGRRWLGPFPRLTGRSWEEVARGLEDFLRKLWESEADGIPSGWGDETLPTNVEPGASPSIGTGNQVGWAAADHVHGVETEIPETVGVRIPEAEGDSTAIARADHVHKVEAIRTFGVTVDGGPSPISVGFKGFVAVPYSGTVIGWNLEAEQVGSCVVDVWKSDRRPNALNSICGTSKPTLSSAIFASGGTTGWSELTLEAGDIVGFYIDSASTITLATLVVEVRES